MTSTALAERDPSAVMSDEIARIRAWLASSASPDEAADAADQLRQTREWMRIQKAATELRIEALRLEFTAIRRVGQSGRDELLPKNLRTVARDCAAMTDAAFRLLLAELNEAASPRAVWNRRQRAIEVEEWRDYGRKLAADIDKPQPHRDITRVQQAAHILLSEMRTEAQPFTVASATERLAEVLVEQEEVDWMTSAARDGLAEVVREALRVEYADASGPLKVGGRTYRVPAFVTYHEGDVGWIRVPVAVAGISQLKAMAELRQIQAQQLAAAASELADLAALLASTGATTCVEALKELAMLPPGKRRAA